MQFILLSYPENGRHSTTQTYNSDVTACCVLLFVKREVHRCDFLQFVVHFYSHILLIVSFNFNFSSQYILWGLTSCNTSNIMYYTVILCHKLVILVLVRLIAIKNINRAINRD